MSPPPSRYSAARVRRIVAAAAITLCVACGASTLAEPPPERVPYVETIHDVVGFGRGPGRMPEGERHRRVSEPGSPSAWYVELEADESGSAWFASAPMVGSHPFRDVLPSWNVDCPEQAGFVAELRVAPDAASPWSPWMHVGAWGSVPALEYVTEYEGGRIETDWFRGERRFERAQLRVRAFAAPGAGPQRVVVRELTCCVSDPELQVRWSPLVQTTLDGGSLARTPNAKRRLPVPFRSQRAEDPAIAGRICSPTAVAMVLAYHGVDVPTADVCARAYDARNDIYGNWPHNVQAAYSFGVPGYVTRMRCFRDVEELIAAGRPLIASIAVKEGQLHGAPYTSSDGHLLVVTGFDENGDVLVNDPAAADAASGRTVYARAEMQTVWLDRGGTAYVLLPPH